MTRFQRGENRGLGGILGGIGGILPCRFTVSDGGVSHHPFFLPEMATFRTQIIKLRTYMLKKL